MSTKRILRWGIVLFLLAALPAMTVALAQGQEPVGKQLPVVTEPGESQALQSWDIYESESNNTRATADPFYYGDGVMGGKMDASGDIDYFILERDFTEEYFLIDIDHVESINPNQLDPVVCLEDRYGNILSCNDDSEGVDSLLFHSAGDVQYITVTDYWGDGGNDYKYELTVSVPLLVSAAPGGLGTGYVDGIPFQSGDVLAYSEFADWDKWVMLFDASDVGVNTLANLAADTGDQMLFSVGANQSLPGLGTVKPWDILTFNSRNPYKSEEYWQQYGPYTAGTFAMYLKGSQKQLTTSAEKLDAIDNSGGHRCGGNGPLVSTTGIATVTGQSGVMKQDDEDAFCLDTNGRWNWGLDINGKFDGPNPVTVAGMPAEDVVALAFHDYYETYVMTIAGTGKIDGLSVNQKDILLYDGYYVDYFWRGPQHGWNYKLDAIEVGYDR